MKRVLAFLLIAVFALSLCGCAFLRYDPHRYDHGVKEGKQKGGQRVYDQGEHREGQHR